MPTVDSAAVAAIAGAYHGAPFDVLGIHSATAEGKPALAVRAWQPQAQAVSVKRGADLIPMERVHPEGFFEAVLPGEAEFFRYQLSITLLDGVPGVAFAVWAPNALVFSQLDQSVVRAGAVGGDRFGA